NSSEGSRVASHRALMAGATALLSFPNSLAAAIRSAASPPFSLCMRALTSSAGGSFPPGAPMGPGFFLGSLSASLAGGPPALGTLSAFSPGGLSPLPLFSAPLAGGSSSGPFFGGNFGAGSFFFGPFPASASGLPAFGSPTAGATFGAFVPFGEG